MKKALLMLALAFVFIINTASADFYFGYADSDYYFEIYNGDSYAYVSTPYTYYANDYYYFDYPYRVYSYGDYYYFNSGWYSYDDYWRFAPDMGSYYSYYSPSYYYYDGYWTYEPDWVMSYGPAYYGSYYYPPNYANSYYYPSYSTIYDTYYYGGAYYAGYANYYPGPYAGVGEPTLVGQNYQPVQMAECGQMSVSTSSLSIPANSRREVTFTIRNNSIEYLDVENVRVYVGAVGIDAKNIEFDKTIKNGSYGTVSFDLVNTSTYTGNASAEITVNATFRDGTSCSIDESFSINSQGSAPQAQYESCSTTGVYCNAQGSTSYYEAKESKQKWADVEPSVSVAPAPVIAEPEPAPVQLRAQNCEGLDLSEKNMVVESGETRTQYFTLRNYSVENFHIDKLEGIDYSADFDIEASRDSKKVYSGATTSVKVKALASESAQDSTGTGYVRLTGHFDSGLECVLTSDNFYVRVNGFEKEQGLEKVKLSNPSEVEISGNSGFIALELDNPTNEAITVAVYSDNATVSPKEFTINAKTLGERVIAINNLEDSEATVYFEAESKGNEFLTKYTKISQVAAEPVNEYLAAPVAVEGDEGESNEEGNGAGFGALMATGFGVLAENALILGIAALAILAVLFLATRE